MDNLILPDKVLNQQICTECQNYLSVGPVMVSYQGKAICGRCSDSGHTELKYSQYNFVAQKLVFKCINYYGGCKAQLLFNEAVEHEKVCKRKNLMCPFCNYEGNGCQLFHHFDNEHPAYMVNEDTFKLTVEDEFLKSLIFVKNSLILCMTILVRNQFIKISNLLVTPANLASEYFKLRFFESDSHLEIPHFKIVLDPLYFMKTDMYCDKLYRHMVIDCFPSGWCFCKIKLIENESCDSEEGILNCFTKIVKENHIKFPAEINTKESIKKTLDFYIDCLLKMPIKAIRNFIDSELHVVQICVNCKRFVKTNVYLCPKYHIACKECTFHKCSGCKMFCQWNNESRLHFISLVCEWDGCFKHTNLFDYVNHKQSCKFRVYHCPDKSCIYFGHLTAIRQHWHLNPLIFDRLIDLPARNYAVYWLNSECNEMFYVTSEFDPCSYTTIVTVNEADVVIHKRYELWLDDFMGNPCTRYFFGKKCNRFVHYYELSSQETYGLTLE